MKLYLSSQGVPDAQALHDLIGKPPDETRVTVIPNAFDHTEPAKRAEYLGLVDQSIEALGYHPRNIDLREYHSSDELQLVLNETDLVWVTGGNTFHLRYVAKTSGFDQALPAYLEHGVYFGESAGSVLVGETLRGIEILDDPAESPEAFEDGLRLVDFSIVPHWNTSSYQKWLQKCYDEMLPHTREVVTLTDEQAIIIDGDSRRQI